MIRPLILFIFLGLYSASNSFAQEYDTFWNYDISDGLSTNSNYDLMIDSKGKVWFGSDFGVTYYDGNTFQNFTTDDGLNDNTVLRCFEDNKGRIWFHHNNRLPSYLENGKIHKITIKGENVVVTSSSEFTQLKNGKIYLGCTNGFLEFDTSLKVKFLKENVGSPCSVVTSIDNQIISLSYLNANTKTNTININKFLPPFTKGYYNLNSCLNRSVEYTKNNFIENSKKLNINNEFGNSKYGIPYYLLIHNSKTYYCTSKGIYIFKNDGGKVTLEKHILKNKQVVSLKFDRAGNMWASSLETGIYFFPSNELREIFKEIDKKITSQSAYKNSVFYGFDNGEIMTSNGGELTDFYRTNDKNATIQNVQYFQDGTLLYDTQFKIEIVTPGKKIQTYPFTHSTYKTIYFNQKYYLTSHSGVVILDSKLKKLDFHYSQLFGKTRKIIEYKNELYIATQTGLFKLIEGKPKKILTSQTENTRVNDLAVYQGKLIISTGNNGLLIFDGKTISNLNSKSGLLSNQVTLLRNSKRNTIWLATSLGLQEILISDNAVYEKNRIDLKTNILTSEVVDMEDVGKYLLITTENGLYSSNNEKSNKLNKLELFIEDFKVNSVNFNSKSNIIEYGDNIKIVTSAPNFTKHSTEFFYRLNGSDWVKNNSETFTFLQLSPGDYKLEIFVKSIFFKDSDIKTIEFSVNEKWYQNIYLIIIGFLLVTIAIILIIRNRSLKRSERKRNELKTELLSLQSQMNPHFTFNSLNSIQSYMSTHDMREAQIYLADFANLMRNILDQAKLDLISVETEIKFLKAYLDLEKRRLESQFDYSIHIDPSIEPSEIALPSLLLQPFVENAIWHGVAGLDYKGNISVRFKVVQSQLICEIEDNGLGLEVEIKRKKSRPYHKSQGTQNCKERINLFQEIYHKKIELNIESKDTLNHGTIVTVKFPIIKQNETRNESY